MNRTGIVDILEPIGIRARSIVRKMRETLDELLRRRRAFRNREGHTSFDFALFRHNRKRGVTAIVRARNEAKKIVYCLRSILDIFDEIVFVDNSSDDTTLSLVHHVKAEHDKHNKIKIHSYPFRLARCGPEHDETPEDSVHSLAYYYNWALSHCSFRYVCKWDGDMVLRKMIREPFREFLDQIKAGDDKFWTLSGQTVYRDLAGHYYLSLGEINPALLMFPYGFQQRFYKGKHWESVKNVSHLAADKFGPVAFWELKFADEDEFSHWSTTDWPTQRKKNEWISFQLIREGRIASDRFQKLPSSFLEDEVAGAVSENGLTCG